MYNFNNLGNIELANCLIFLHFAVYGLEENGFDMRKTDWLGISTNYLSKLLNIPLIEVEYPKRLPEKIKFDSSININQVYGDFLKEAVRRGLQYQNVEGDLLESEEFNNWFLKIKNNPTYIREINATNLFGDYDVKYCDDELMGFDPPVREACKILNEKGYKTYWSSANVEDATQRINHIIRGLHVAYILIDAENLSEELKERLILNGDCNLWGVAKGHIDNGKYYGIWAEIHSPNTQCSEISDILSTKALNLPILVNNIAKNK